MSLLDILKLVGFATGAGLHLYIAWLIYRRRFGATGRLSQSERAFVILGLCIGSWFAGNVLTTLQELLVGASRFTGLGRLWQTITLLGVALLPSALLQVHFAFRGELDNYQTLSRRRVFWLTLAGYVPMIFLPYAVYRINSGTFQPFFVKLRFLLVPYSIWYLLAFWVSAWMDWRIKDRLAPEAVRERAFFRTLAILLFITGAFEFLVVGVRRSGPNDVLWVAYILLSLLPTIFVAYYIYRYRIVEIVIKDTLVYAAFAVLFIAVYTYGVRVFDRFLVERYGVRGGVVEVLLILGMMALASPVVRWMDRGVRRLFAREVGIYRDVVRQVAAGAAGFGELESLIPYVESTIRRGLELSAVRVVLLDPPPADARLARLAEVMAQGHDTLEREEDLTALGFTIAYGLWREGRLLGLLLVNAPPATLTSEKRAILDVLARQVVIEIESCRLVEEKVRLERELAERERLAQLGQMAATVAHEVKNPLSSIKSIAQVMREEQELRAYNRDLDLIVSEIDRLNRTVSQLLAFSRPGRAESRPVPLAELLEATAALASGEASERGVRVHIENTEALTLDGTQAAALRETLSNLVLNAVQASETGTEVVIDAARLRDSSNGAGEWLVLSVTDAGPGIAAEEQARIFEPFYTTRSRGTGLGLAIVQRRVAELGGRVELISPVIDGLGTRFRVVVPLQ